MSNSAAYGGIFGPYPSAIALPSAWDQFQVQGVTWFGRVEVVGAMRSYRWDVKDPMGADGEIQTYRGKRTRPFRVNFYLWTDAHFGTWPQYSQLFQYPGSKAGVVTPVAIYHPALAMLGIGAVTCEDLGAVEKVSDDLMFRATVTLREFIPPPPINVTATPPGAAAVSPPNVPGIPVSPAIAAYQARIDALQQQAAALGTPGGLP